MCIHCMLVFNLAHRLPPPCRAASSSVSLPCTIFLCWCQVFWNMTNYVYDCEWAPWYPNFYEDSEPASRLTCYAVPEVSSPGLSAPFPVQQRNCQILWITKHYRLGGNRPLTPLPTMCLFLFVCQERRKKTCSHVPRLCWSASSSVFCPCIISLCWCQLF